MLVDLEKQLIRSVPHEKEYRYLLSRMLPAEIAVVKDRLNEMIDGAEIHTASWMPRKEDWTGPFQPIMWSFGRFEKDGEPIRGMTYFRVAN
jgi:hypothetical protein